MRRKGLSLYSEAIKQIKRLEKAARRVEKRGYEFDLPFRKTKTGQEKTRFTKKIVEWLKGLRTKDLYQYSTYKGKSGLERREEERREASKKAAYTRRIRREVDEESERIYQRYYNKEEHISINQTIIDNFLNRQNWHFLKDSTYDKLVNFIRNKINDLGRASVAQAIQDATTSGFVTQFQRSYDYQFTVNIMMFEDYFESTEDFSDLKQEQVEDEYLDYIEDDEFEEIFG